MKSILDYLPQKSKTGKILWESKFRIHHKIATKLAWENIGIIGDAAHLHSPVGARGMNLGIEDAFVLSNLLHNNRLHTFTDVRKPYIKQTVNGINNLTMVLAGDSMKAKVLRSNIGILKFLAPLIMPKARKFMLGIN